jgi:hypothetical protein
VLGRGFTQRHRKGAVPFDESTDTEMCCQFTFHYPAHALTDGAFSLLGVTNTCW